MDASQGGSPSGRGWLEDSRPALVAGRLLLSRGLELEDCNCCLASIVIFEGVTLRMLDVRTALFSSLFSGCEAGPLKLRE